MTCLVCDVIEAYRGIRPAENTSIGSFGVDSLGMVRCICVLVVLYLRHGPSLRQLPQVMLVSQLKSRVGVKISMTDMHDAGTIKVCVVMFCEGISSPFVILPPSHSLSLAVTMHAPPQGLAYVLRAKLSPEQAGASASL